jgi:hypothetical protein
MSPFFRLGVPVGIRSVSLGAKIDMLPEKLTRVELAQNVTNFAGAATSSSCAAT